MLLRGVGYPQGHQTKVRLDWNRAHARLASVSTIPSGCAEWVVPNPPSRPAVSLSEVGW